MDKKKIAAGYIAIFIAILVKTTFAYGQEQSNIQLFGDTLYQIQMNRLPIDSIIKIKDKDVLIRFDRYGSSVIRVDISIFLESYNEGEDWTIFCLRRTNTSEVTLELNQKTQELVFKAKSGKTLMILPFETFTLEHDRSEI